MQRLPALVLLGCLIQGAYAHAATSATSLCEFLQKVLDAKPSGFAPFKGEAQNRAVFGDTVFHGTYLPPSGTGCTLHTRTTVGRTELPPIYDCTLASIADFGDASRLFTQASIELRACFPLAQFVVMYDGDSRNPRDMFTWSLSSDAPGFRLELQMSNAVSLLSEAFGGGRAEHPEIAVTIDITDTAPADSAI